MRRMRHAARGFTLLEVMVAIAILGLALSAIFSSEAGAAKMAHRARKVGVAALLARCKMAEIQQQVSEEGLPALYDADRDDCCEGAEVEGFRCEWEINPIVLPDNMFAPEGEDPFGPEGDGDSDEPGGGAAGPGSMQPQDLLAGNGMGDLGSMAMQFAFPILKPAFESQIRRATVTVKWREGTVDHDFDVTQYLVSDQPIEMPEAEEQEGEEEPSTGEGIGGGSTTPPTSPSPSPAPGSATGTPASLLQRFGR